MSGTSYSKTAPGENGVEVPFTGKMVSGLRR